MNRISFSKMNGSGNDFIIIDNRRPQIEVERMPRFSAAVCRRKRSVGADGVIFIETSEAADFRWHFFNADGSRAEMCGNGARCAARFAVLNGIAGPRMRFETDAGLIRAVVEDGRVRVQMTEPTPVALDVELALTGGAVVVSAVNTGVPHAVMETADLDALEVVYIGRQIRRHEKFAPAGTNANFATPPIGNRIALRTYERGVEDETLACGTGAVAAALVAATRHGVRSPVEVDTRGGRLAVHFARRGQRFTDVFLEGDARMVSSGEIWEEAWNDA
ncbi:MAG TPA: diaminopimelate epimerase [Desulfobacterales bacterium]